MRFLRRRILSVLMLGCIGLLLIGLLAMVRLYHLNMDVYLDPSSIILGVNV